MRRRGGKRVAEGRAKVQNDVAGMEGDGHGIEGTASVCERWWAFYHELSVLRGNFMLRVEVSQGNEFVDLLAVVLSECNIVVLLLRWFVCCDRGSFTVQFGKR